MKEERQRSERDRVGPRRARRWLACAAACAVGLLGAAAPGAAAAIDEEFLFNFGSGYGADPAEAGKLRFTEGIAVDSRTGHAFVAGFGGDLNRVSEFTPWGEFVKAFGWDVAPGAVNEVQELRVRASEGSFNLSFDGSTTPDLPLGASGAEVEEALDELASIGGAGAGVGVEDRIGSTDGAIPFVYTVVFEGDLGGEDVEEIQAADGATPLSGGDPTTELATHTRADGTPGGTGLEACTAESGCQAGVGGDGSGQLRNVFGIAVAGDGDVIVRENLSTNNRIQRFTSSGRFVWMAGGEVNKTKVDESAPEAERNLCAAGSGDTCQAGSAGGGDGQFQGGFGVALGAGENIYVGDEERIQVLGPGGEYLEDVPVEGLGGETARQIAADPARDRLYLTLEGKEDVRVVDATSGALGDPRPVEDPEYLTVGPEGDLFVREGARFREPEHLKRFDPDGDQLRPTEGELLECEELLESSPSGDCSFFLQADPGASLRGLGTSPIGNLYVANVITGSDSYVKAYGPTPVAYESPPPAPPAITAQLASTVGVTGAQVRARINPRFYSGGLGTTTYYARYATAECVESEGWEGGCVSEKPAPPGTELEAGIVDDPVLSAPIVLDGLEPGTEYRYRFVAEGSGAPGVEIVGVGGTEGAPGADAGFRTYSGAATAQSCPNAAFRVGPSGALPDCRAYEMVSPLDKAGGEIKVLTNTRNLPAVLEQSSPSGDKLAYGTFRAFGDSQSSPYTAQYIATRGASGWDSAGISPPRTTQIFPPVGQADTEFKQFSEDLCAGWLRTFAEPPLAPGAVAGLSNLYRRDNCGGPPSYQALTTVDPPGAVGEGYQPELQGTSADGATTIYTANAKLTAAAPTPPEDNEWLLYARGAGGELAYVCVLPGGAPSGGPCTAGGQAVNASGQNLIVRLDNAISDDGDRVYWSDHDDSIYLREDPLGAGSTTEVAGADSQYWGASPDGERAIYSQAGSLHRFELASEASEEIAADGVSGVAGMSEDARAVYFVSSSDLDGGGPARGEEPNLYLWREGEGTRFLASAAGAVEVDSREPRLRQTRVSADGAHLLFMSRAPLTGYDNTDQASGEADAEVFLYDAEASGGAGRLLCVSCNPSGAQPRGAEVRGGVWAAAQIPVAENNLRESRVLSADGRRVYFESFDALSLRDTNGAKDVYQWEEAGAGGCAVGAASYSAAAGGCVDLISSGSGTIDSEFVEASPSGDSVFFVTLSSLVAQDPDLADVYVARVNGGFPAPPAPTPECEGETCQAPAAAPAPVISSSSGFVGPGNLAPPKKKARQCPKGKRKVKRKGKTRCVKRKPAKAKAKRHHRRAAGHDRRARR